MSLTPEDKKDIEELVRNSIIDYIKKGEFQSLALFIRDSTSLNESALVRSIYDKLDNYSPNNMYSTQDSEQFVDKKEYVDKVLLTLLVEILDITLRRGILKVSAKNDKQAKEIACYLEELHRFYQKARKNFTALTNLQELSQKEQNLLSEDHRVEKNKSLVIGGISTLMAWCTVILPLTSPLEKHLAANKSELSWLAPLLYTALNIFHSLFLVKTNLFVNNYLYTILPTTKKVEKNNLYLQAIDHATSSVPPPITTESKETSTPDKTNKSELEECFKTIMSYGTRVKELSPSVKDQTWTFFQPAAVSKTTEIREPQLSKVIRHV